MIFKSKEHLLAYEHRKQRVKDRRFLTGQHEKPEEPLDDGKNKKLNQF